MYGADPLATICLIDQLSRARTAYLIGQALTELYPDEASWDAALKRRDVLRLIEQVSDQLQAVRRTLPQLGPDAAPEEIQAAVQTHYDSTIEVVTDLAAFLNVDPEDLLTFLVAP